MFNGGIKRPPGVEAGRSDYELNMLGGVGDQSFQVQERNVNVAGAFT